MELDELKWMQLSHQHLLTPVDVLCAVRDLCGVQAQFLSHALHAIAIRSGLPVVTDGLVKSWAMRGTMHIFAESDLPLILHEGRTHYLRPCDTMQADVHCTAARKRELADALLSCVDHGICEREQLRQALLNTGMSRDEAESIFDPWGGLIRALCECGELVHLVQEKKAYRRPASFVPVEAHTGKLALARRYFTHYGPASVKDAAYFFGTTQKAVRALLDELPVQRAECAGRTYYSIASDEIRAQSLPECVLLAGFDPLLMGYEKTESLYLPHEHLRAVFTLTGIVRPTVLLCGEIAAVWKRKNRTVELMPLRALTSGERSAIAEETQRLWGEDMRLKITGAEG